MTAIDETNNHYGRLTVLRRMGSNKHKKALWLCQCSCGKNTITSGVRLRSGKTKSCGCLQKLPEGLAVFHDKLRMMKANAKRKHLDWAISDEDVLELIKKNCYYCGAAPAPSKKKLYRNGRLNGDFPSNGLDRVDNDKGYTLDNVVPCCSNCNSLKGARNIIEFKEQITKIYKYFIESSK